MNTNEQTAYIEGPDWSHELIETLDLVIAGIAGIENPALVSSRLNNMNDRDTCGKLLHHIRECVRLDEQAAEQGC